MLTLSGNPFQRYCQVMAADSSYFDFFILGCILANTIIMAINWYGAPASLLDSLEFVNYFFTAVFTIEAFIKLIAFSPRGYFYQGWNVFDFTIVLISYITLIIGQMSGSNLGPKQSTVARAFRIGRIFRLVTKAKFLRVIFNTIIFTIPSLANVGALMMLLLFIFSILGVQIFATVQLQTVLNEHANFQNFGIALLTLIRFQTGEGWNDVMKDLAR
jgi:voltage-dependent calcium channel L type alpha-1D